MGSTISSSSKFEVFWQFLVSSETEKFYRRQLRSMK